MSNDWKAFELALSALTKLQLDPEARGAEIWKFWKNRCPQEIRSGAIISSELIPGTYSIEANTEQGLRKFIHAYEIQPSDPQTLQRTPSQTDFIANVPFAYHSDDTSRTGSFFNDHLYTKTPKQWIFTSLAREAAKQIKPLSAEAFIKAFRRKGLNVLEQRNLIIEAEVMAFSQNHTKVLNRLLRTFIDKNRDSNDFETQIAVGAAIRKLVSNLTVEDLDTISDLLSPQGHNPVPLAIELEVCKTLVRKLTSVPLPGDNAKPQLADRLIDLARAYLNVRLLSREKYGATALNAIIALLLLRSNYYEELLRELSQLEAPWFLRLLQRRATRLISDLNRRFPKGPDFAIQLKSLIEIPISNFSTHHS